MRIVADENMPAVEALFGPDAVIVRAPGRSIDHDALRDADALLVRSVTRVTASLVYNTPLKFVGTATAGTEHIDREALRAAGIGFASAPGANANSVVEYVLAAIAAVDTFLERLLAGACVGIAGFGHVGSALAARLGDLGIRYVAYDPWLQEGIVSAPASLDQVLRCDVICLHPELTLNKPWPSHHLLNADNLGGLSGNQLLINASRGSVIDNAALLDRLRATSAPNVVLDVWEGEPAINVQLLEAVRLGTAHIAGYSLDAKVQATKMLYDAMVQSRILDAPRSDSPLAAPLPLTLTHTDSAAGVIRQLLTGSYGINEDDRLLRANTRDKAPAEASAGFDRLRKQYSERRELRGREVNIPASMQDYSALVAALGCTVLNQEH